MLWLLWAGLWLFWAQIIMGWHVVDWFVMEFENVIHSGWALWKARVFSKYVLDSWLTFTDILFLLAEWKKTYSRAHVKHTFTCSHGLCISMLWGGTLNLHICSMLQYVKVPWTRKTLENYAHCHIFTESHIYDCFRRYISSITTRRSSTQKTCFQGICSASNSLNRKTEHNGTMLPEYWFCFYHMRRQTFSPVNPMARKVSTIFFAVFVAKHLQITTKKHARFDTQLDL